MERDQKWNWRGGRTRSFIGSYIFTVANADLVLLATRKINSLINAMDGNEK